MLRALWLDPDLQQMGRGLFDEGLFESDADGDPPESAAPRHLQDESPDDAKDDHDDDDEPPDAEADVAEFLAGG
eukprot:661482-Pyramimonas_sp.AAC.1